METLREDSLRNYPLFQEGSPVSIIFGSPGLDAHLSNRVRRFSNDNLNSILRSLNLRKNHGRFGWIYRKRIKDEDPNLIDSMVDAIKYVDTDIIDKWSDGYLTIAKSSSWHC
jgi:hypothetical protein